MKTVVGDAVMKPCTRRSSCCAVLWAVTASRAGSCLWLSSSHSMPICGWRRSTYNNSLSRSFPIRLLLVLYKNCIRLVVTTNNMIQGESETDKRMFLLSLALSLLHSYVGIHTSLTITRILLIIQQRQPGEIRIGTGVNPTATDTHKYIHMKTLESKEKERE